MMQDFIFCLQEAASSVIFKKPWTPKEPSECFINPPCGCAHPGKDLKCEDCPHLEACLSSFKLQKAYGSKDLYVPIDTPILQIDDSDDSSRLLAGVETREHTNSYSQ